MADRWSEPSDSLGTERFRVWPEPTDSYDNVEMADNWDMVDNILGLPSSGKWPTSVGVDGGIYKEIQKVRFAATPLGTVFPWFRPSVVVPLPDGYEVADGSVIAAIDHDFPTTDPVTLPDLRNAFVIGAEPDAENEVVVPNTNNNQLDAPGPQGTGGSNTVTMVKKELPTHSHDDGSYTGWSPAVMTWYFQQSTYAIQQTLGKYLDGRDEAIDKCGYPGCYYDPERTAPIHAANGNFRGEEWGAGANHSTGRGGWKTGQHRHNITGLSGAGSNASHENRPLYIGMIYLVKVRVT